MEKYKLFCIAEESASRTLESKKMLVLFSEFPGNDPN